jgi:hypothetical protein
VAEKGRHSWRSNLIYSSLRENAQKTTGRVEKVDVSRNNWYRAQPVDLFNTLDGFSDHSRRYRKTFAAGF